MGPSVPHVVMVRIQSVWWKGVAVVGVAVFILILLLLLLEAEWLRVTQEVKFTLW